MTERERLLNELLSRINRLHNSNKQSIDEFSKLVDKYADLSALEDVYQQMQTIHKTMEQCLHLKACDNNNKICKRCHTLYLDTDGKCAICDKGKED